MPARVATSPITWLLARAAAIAGAIACLVGAVLTAWSLWQAWHSLCSRPAGRALAAARIVRSVQTVFCVVAAYGWLPEPRPTGIGVMVRGRERRNSTARAWP